MRSLSLPFGLGSSFRFYERISTRRTFHNSSLALTNKKPLVSLYWNTYKKQTNPAVMNLDYFEDEALKLPIDNNYIDELKVIYWEKYLARRDRLHKTPDQLIGKPINAQAYGLPDVDKKQLRPEYAHIEALQKCDENIRKIYTIEYGSRRDLTNAWKKSMISSLGLPETDNESLSFRIAWTTAIIRHSTLLEDEWQIKRPFMKSQPPRRKRLHRNIIQMIHWRRQMLQALRAKDEEEFNRVVKILKISYLIRKPAEENATKTRKIWSENQIKKRVAFEKEKQLQAIRKELETNREEKVKAINIELKKLEEEEANITKRLVEIDLIEGKYTGKIDGTYQPDLISDYYKHKNHDRIGFHYSRPDLVVPEDHDLLRATEKGEHAKKFQTKASDVQRLKRQLKEAAKGHTTV